MYSLKVNTVYLPRVARKTRHSKLSVFKGDDAYETFTKRLDSIDAKLLQIETHLNIDQPIFKEIKEDFHVVQNPQIIELEAQLAEANSEARRDALQQRIQQLKST